LSIGYVNICSSVQDNRQKFSVYLKYRFWNNKWEQWNQQSKGTLKHLKKVLMKSSAPEVMTSSEASSSEAPHQKQNHQKLKITRSWRSSEDERIKASKAAQRF